MSLKDRFADFLSEIEQTEKVNEKLTEDIQKLEKEQAEGWKKFDTDTHILVERDSLNSLVNKAEGVVSYIQDARYDIEETSSNSGNAENQISYAESDADELEHQIRDLLKVDTEKVEE